MMAQPYKTMTQDNLSMTSMITSSKSIENKVVRTTLRAAWVLLTWSLCLLASCSSSDDDNATPTKDDNQTFTVTFDLNGGTGTAPDQTIKKDDKATKPADPTRDGYTFGNWYTDKATTKVFAFTTPITADITLYAGWTAVYTVTFDLGGGTGDAPTAQTVEKDNKATKPDAPIRDGYTFDNWYTDAETTKVFAFTTPITKAMTLYAGWIIKTYTVTFDLNGGTGTSPTTATVKHGKTTTKPATPTKDGYTFDNWYTQQDGSGTAFAFDTTPITADITLYAGWTIKTYTVTFDLNGGTGTAPDPQTVTKDGKATKPATPTRDGYTFDNWYTQQDGSGTAFAFDTTTVTADRTLYAGWTIKTYTVTFDLNGGTGTAPTAATVEYGKTTTKPADPTKDGYIFKGWYTQQNGSGTAFAFATTPITADITLYAGGWVYPYSMTLAGTEYAGVADDTSQTILVDIGKVYKKINGETVGLVVTDSAGKTVANESVTLTQAKATIDVTRDGNTYTVLKLFVKPTTKAELTAIVNAAIDTTNGEGDTVNLNFVDTSHITDMSELFKDKATFNGDVSEWDTSKVTNMNAIFSGAKAFNKGIGNWDTSKVTSMEKMFFLAAAFNQDIGRWKTDNVTNMSDMFNGADVFNQDIGNWNTAKVTNMQKMFWSADVFNQDIGRWNTAKVTDIRSMFQNAKAFNQDIGEWKTGEVTDMSNMFYGADAFNQDIGSWKTDEVTDMSNMFYDALAFDQNLSGWNVAKVTSHGNIFVGSAMADTTTQHPKFK